MEQSLDPFSVLIILRRRRFQFISFSVSFKTFPFCPFKPLVSLNVIDGVQVKSRNVRMRKFQNVTMKLAG